MVTDPDTGNSAPAAVVDGEAIWVRLPRELLQGAPAHAPIGVNQDLELQLGDNWRRAGTVLSVYQDGEQCLLTSVLNNDLEADAVLRIKGQDDSRLSLQALPYSLLD